MVFAARGINALILLEALAALVWLAYATWLYAARRVPCGREP